MAGRMDKENENGLTENSGISLSGRMDKGISQAAESGSTENSDIPLSDDCVDASGASPIEQCPTKPDERNDIAETSAANASSSDKSSDDVPHLFSEWHRNCEPAFERYEQVQQDRANKLQVRRHLSDLIGAGNCCVPSKLFKNDSLDLTLVEQQRQFASIGRSVSKHSVKYIDTHCHLDLLFNNEQHYGTFQSYKKRRPITWARSFEGCITDFCFPEMFINNNRWEDLLKEPDVYGAFGCHPHAVNLYNQELEDLITARMCHEKVVAIGEMGLDYSRNNHQNEELQKSVLRKQLKLALNWQKPIVIHCREAEEDCFAIMKEMVPHNVPIHRHCFKGSYATATRWVDYFTNLKFGFTPFVANVRSVTVDEILKELPLERILIETDSPYFLPDCYKECDGMIWNHPGVGFIVGAKLADIRNIPLVQTMEIIRQNTRDIYGI